MRRFSSKFFVRLWQPLTALTVVSIANFLHAAVITFDNGGLDNRWLNATNWNPNGLPDNNDTAQIYTGSTAIVDQAGAISDYVDVRNGGTLVVTGGDLTFGFGNNRWLWVGLGSAGTVLQSGGTVQSVGTNSDVVVDSFGLYELSGGLLDVVDDLRLEDGSQFRIVGAPTLDIGDDLLTENGGNALLEIVLVGNTLPIINVGDQLRLGGDVSLNIDTTQWTGSSNISLFNASGNIFGDFAVVSVNGVPLDPSDYTIGSGNIAFQVTEPSNSLTTLVGIGIACLLFSRHTRQRTHAIARNVCRSRTGKRRFDLGAKPFTACHRLQHCESNRTDSAVC